MKQKQPNRAWERLHRAFAEFLTIPVLVVLGFLLLAVGVYLVDASVGPRDEWGSIWRSLDRIVGDPQAATALLSTIAGGLITLTSITFSILLLAVQQGAASLTSQIFDQYLRRPSNQVYFGLFIGVSIYTLVTLVLTSDGHRPVLGATLAVLFAAAALCALVLLIYSTIDQTKPITIMTTIHDTTLRARDGQAGWLGRTAEPPPGLPGGVAVASRANGYLARIDGGGLARIAERLGDATIEIRVSLGDYVPCGATLAIVRSSREPGPDAADALRAALPLEEQRDARSDPAFGVDQLVTIGWTSISTAKSNPGAALIACHALHDLLWRWGSEEKLELARAAAPLVYYRDTLAEQLLDGFESLALVASESMQHQSLGAVMHALAASFAALPVRCKDRAEDILLRSLASLGDHGPTRLLEARFEAAVAALAGDGRNDAAARMAAAWAKLSATRGALHSRGTRA